ncbi:MAG TPA: transcriptional repressor [Gammaproteobacteria bacterium]|nr:transcriptional repressor [Gammaproteobacteria bacterium]MCH78292.1 transcriptional repressor [Gammaproteobacteria bacterium]
MHKKRLQQVLSQAERVCRERGARLTPQRRAVLEKLCAAERPVTAYELLDLMRDQLRNPAPPTIYRALDFLQEQGLVHRLESLNAFIGCSHPDHPHASQFLICADCGEVAEVEDNRVAKSLSAASRAAGFQAERRVVELLGTCAQCAEKPPPAR